MLNMPFVLHDPPSGVEKEMLKFVNANIAGMIVFHIDLLEENVDYIGTRLHGGVFALQNSVRSLVISIDHRARGFHEKNNLPIMERKDVPNRLEAWINADNKTKIWIDEKAIGEFKAQFA